jgi:hypothetical protein
MSDNIAELVSRLEEEAERLSGHSIDRSSVDAGISSNLATEAAQALTRIAGERDALLSGETAVLPHTRRHAEDLYTVAVACLKTYGVDVESRAQAAEVERDRLREALRPFVPAEPMASLLWGDMDDDATGTITVKLADFRRAREALRGETKP